MKKISLLITTGLTSIFMLNDQAQVQTNKAYTGGPVSFVSFVPSQRMLDNPYPAGKEHGRKRAEIPVFLMKGQAPASVQKQEMPGYIVPGPAHKSMELPKHLQDYIIRKFSWDMVFK